VAEQPS